MVLKGNRIFLLLLAPQTFLALWSPGKKGVESCTLQENEIKMGWTKYLGIFVPSRHSILGEGVEMGIKATLISFKCFATNYMIFFLPDALVWQKFNSLQSVPWWLNAHLVDNTSSYFSPQQQSCLDERLLLDALSSGSYFTSYKSKIYSRQKRHLHGNAYYEIMPDVQMFYNYDFLFWRCS